MPQAVVPLMVATTAVTAYGTYQAGKAQEKQAQYNSQIIERDAEIKENNLKDFDKLVNFEVAGLRREYNAYRGQNVVKYASSGVELSGTVEEVMRANLETYLDDEYNFRYNAEKEKQGEADAVAMSRIQASAVRAKGKYQRAAANLQTVGTLLQGASQVGQYQMLT
ncbi:MAG: hypothetical protein CBC83_00640 [Flavobacteriales bacterium TMED123]|nr:MAG: hypothetical protein CBC83_00640 [Flavobacteriales bacterium TMED123]|tara:strand:+ start:197 stop:694 length:498 start_codon:yes stop_codon:yes gene_type:complete